MVEVDGLEPTTSSLPANIDKNTERTKSFGINILRRCIGCNNCRNCTPSRPVADNCPFGVSVNQIRGWPVC